MLFDAQSDCFNVRRRSHVTTTLGVKGCVIHVACRVLHASSVYSVRDMEEHLLVLGMPGYYEMAYLESCGRWWGLDVSLGGIAIEGRHLGTCTKGSHLEC